MTWKLEKKTFRWKYVESLEPARVVHVRTTDMLSKENVYAQVTVRFLTRQVTDSSNDSCLWQWQTCANENTRSHVNYHWTWSRHDEPELKGGFTMKQSGHSQRCGFLVTKLCTACNNLNKIKYRSSAYVIECSLDMYLGLEHAWLANLLAFGSPL